MLQVAKQGKAAAHRGVDQAECGLDADQRLRSGRVLDASTSLLCTGIMLCQQMSREVTMHRRMMNQIEQIKKKH